LCGNFRILFLLKGDVGFVIYPNREINKYKKHDLKSQTNQRKCIGDFRLMACVDVDVVPT
jgi:hypothetical protein